MKTTAKKVPKKAVAKKAVARRKRSVIKKDPTRNVECLIVQGNSRWRDSACVSCGKNVAVGKAAVYIKRNDGYYTTSYHVVHRACMIKALTDGDKDGEAYEAEFEALRAELLKTYQQA